MIKGHHNRYNNDEKVWNTGIITKCDREMKQESAIGIMVPINLHSAGLPQTFYL